MFLMYWYIGTIHFLHFCQKIWILCDCRLPFVLLYMRSWRAHHPSTWIPWNLSFRYISLYWSIHTKNESKRVIAFAFIFGVNWLKCCGVTASFVVFFHEIKCNRMTSFINSWAVETMPLNLDHTSNLELCSCSGFIYNFHIHGVEVLRQQFLDHIRFIFICLDDRITRCSCLRTRMSLTRTWPECNHFGIMLRSGDAMWLIIACWIEHVCWSVWLIGKG